MPDKASGYHSTDFFDAMSGALIYDAMSGVKKLSNFMHVITCPTSGNGHSVVKLWIGRYR